jgi:hypothetical protein
MTPCIGLSVTPAAPVISFVVIAVALAFAPVLLGRSARHDLLAPPAATRHRSQRRVLDVAALGRPWVEADAVLGDGHDDTGGARALILNILSPDMRAALAVVSRLRQAGEAARLGLLRVLNRLLDRLDAMLEAVSAEIHSIDSCSRSAHTGRA